MKRTPSDARGTIMENVGSLLNKPNFYYNVDGVGELGCGVMGTGFSLYIWIGTHSSAHSFWNQLYPLFIFALLLSALIYYGSKAIKKRVTFPRTGFVSYRKSNRVLPTLVVSTVCSVITGVGFAFALRFHLDVATPASLFLGVFLTASYAWSIARAVRWKWIVVWALALASIVVALLPEGFVEAMVGQSLLTNYFSARLAGALLLYLFLSSTIILISGGISFWFYVRHTPQPSTESE